MGFFLAKAATANSALCSVVEVFSCGITLLSSNKRAL